MRQMALSAETGDRVCTCCCGDIAITPADQTVSLAIITGVQDTYIVHKSQVTYSRQYVATGTCYLLQLGFRPVAVVGRLVQEQERDSKKGETIHKNN